MSSELLCKISLIVNQGCIMLYSGLNQKRVNSPLDTMRDRRDQIESVRTLEE